MNAQERSTMSQSNAQNVVTSIQQITEGVWCTNNYNNYILNCGNDIPQSPNTTGVYKPNPTATTYAQAVKRQPTTQHLPSPHTYPTSTAQPTTPNLPNDLSELHRMMYNLMDQMSTLINFISVLVSKQTNG